jgi:hypothetical protein
LTAGRADVLEIPAAGDRARYHQDVIEAVGTVDPDIPREAPLAAKRVLAALARLHGLADHLLQRRVGHQ